MITKDDYEWHGPITIKFVTHELSKKYPGLYFACTMSGNEGYANGSGPYFSEAHMKMYTVIGNSSLYWPNPRPVIWHED